MFSEQGLEIHFAYSGSVVWQVSNLESAAREYQTLKRTMKIYEISFMCEYITPAVVAAGLASTDTRQH
jgi:hypothetical protein